MWRNVSALNINNMSATKELMKGLDFRSLSSNGILEAVIKIVYREELIAGTSLCVERETINESDNLAQLVSLIAEKENTVSIVRIDTDEYDRSLEILKEATKNDFEGYEALEKNNEVMLSAKLPIAIYKNKKIETNYLWVQAGNSYIETDIVLASVFPWSLEWLKPLESIEKDDIAHRIIDCLSDYEHGYDTFVEIVEEISEKLGFDTIVAKPQIDAFENNILASKKESIKRNLRESRERYESYMREARKYVESIKRYELYMLAFNNCEVSHDLGKLFANSSNIKFVKADSGAITFDVIQDILSFDNDIYEKYRDMGDNYLSCTYEGMNKNDLLMLTDALFRDMKLTLTSCCRITLNCNGGIDSQKIPTPTGKFKNAIPHPHIVNYNCFGGFSAMVTDAIVSGNYTDAINVLISATSNFNITDTTVGEKLWETLARTDIKCIHTYEGEYMTPKEAVQYLKGEM